MSDDDRYMQEFWQAQRQLRSPDREERDKALEWLDQEGIARAPSRALKWRALKDMEAELKEYYDFDVSSPAEGRAADWLRACDFMWRKAST